MQWDDAVAQYSTSPPAHGFTWQDILSSEELKLAKYRLGPPPETYSTASAAVVDHIDNVFMILTSQVAEAPAAKKQRVESSTGTSFEFNFMMLG